MHKMIQRADIRSVVAPISCHDWIYLANVGTGDNALWLGSTKAGIRLFPKGDEDLWQAGAVILWLVLVVIVDPQL